VILRDASATLLFASLGLDAEVENRLLRPCKAMRISWLAYPGDPLARRVRAIVAARREAITRLRTYRADTPQAKDLRNAKLPANDQITLAFLNASRSRRTPVRPSAL
jgi:hypothetical protein